MHVDVSARVYCVWCSCDVASERRPYFVSSSSLVLDHKWWKMERKKGQCYNSKYGTEFDFITKSGKSKQHAFCTICRRDISIAHGGRSDIVLHTKSKLHIGNFESESSSTPKITSWMSTSQDLNVTRAECLFTSFYLEHNIPLSAHMRANIPWNGLTAFDAFPIGHRFPFFKILT